MRHLAQAYPETNATLQGEVLPFWQSLRGPRRFLAAALGALQAIMLLLLLAVCGNTANLVLARASARHREMGVRLALGAAPSRVVSLLLTENVVLAALGAALGAAIAVWGTTGAADRAALGAADQVSDERRRFRSCVRHDPWSGVRPPVRRGAGGAARAR